MPPLRFETRTTRWRTFSFPPFCHLLSIPRSIIITVITICISKPSSVTLFLATPQPKATTTIFPLCNGKTRIKKKKKRKGEDKTHGLLLVITGISRNLLSQNHLGITQPSHCSASLFLIWIVFSSQLRRKYYPRQNQSGFFPFCRFGNYQIVFSVKPWSSGRDSCQKSRLLLIPTWQCLWKSSRLTNRVELPDSDREIIRSTSSNSASSQGIAKGPWLEKPYSSSAWIRSFLKAGWFRYVARTTNLLQLVPTQTATCPAGTSEGMRLADMRALLRHRRSIWRILTMWRILLHFPTPADIFFLFSRKWRKRKLSNTLFWVLFVSVVKGEREKKSRGVKVVEKRWFYNEKIERVPLVFEIITKGCLPFMEHIRGQWFTDLSVLLHFVHTFPFFFYFFALSIYTLLNNGYSLS